MKPDSKLPETYITTAPPSATSEEVVQLLAAILRRVQSDPFVPRPLGAEAEAAARAYDRICSSLDHETPLRAIGIARK